MKKHLTLCYISFEMKATTVFAEMTLNVIESGKSKKNHCSWKNFEKLGQKNCEISNKKW